MGKTGRRESFSAQRQSAPAVSKDEMTREDTCPLTVRNEARRKGNRGISSHPAEHRTAPGPVMQNMRQSSIILSHPNTQAAVQHGASAGECSHVRLEVEAYRKKAGGFGGR